MSADDTDIDEVLSAIDALKPPVSSTRAVILRNMEKIAAAYERGVSFGQISAVLTQFKLEVSGPVLASYFYGWPGRSGVKRRRASARAAALPSIGPALDTLAAIPTPVASTSPPPIVPQTPQTGAYQIKPADPE